MPCGALQNARNRKLDSHFLFAFLVAVLYQVHPGEGSFLGSSKAVFAHGCDDHWTLADPQRMPQLTQMTLCVDVRPLDTEGEWTAFTYSKPPVPHYSLALQGDPDGLYVWLLGVQHHFPTRLAPLRWHHMCLQHDAGRRTMTLEVDGEVFKRTVITQAIPPAGELVLGCHSWDTASPKWGAGGAELYLFRIWDDVRKPLACEDGTVVGWNSRDWHMTGISRFTDDTLLCEPHVVQCSFSEFCAIGTAYYWMSVNLETTGKKTEAELSTWLSQVFNISTCVPSSHTTDSPVHKTANNSTDRDQHSCKNEAETAVSLLQGIEVICNTKEDIRVTNCTVVLQLYQPTDTCLLRQVLQESSLDTSIQAHVLGDVERVGQGLCQNGDTLSPDDGFVRCTSSTSLSDVCSSGGPVNVTCTYKEPAYIPMEMHLSVSQLCNRKEQQYCDCSNFCRDTAAYYVLEVDILSASVSIADVRKMVSQLSSGQTCISPVTICPFFRLISEFYQGAHLQCHGTESRLYSCMVVLKLSQPVDMCAASTVMLYLLEDSDDINFNGAVTRAAICGWPSGPVADLLNSTFTWVSVDLHASEICDSLNPVIFSCKEDEILGVLLKESCRIPTSPPSTSTSSPVTMPLFPPTVTPSSSHKFSTPFTTPKPFNSATIHSTPLSSTTQEKTTASLLNTTTEQNTTALSLTATTQQNTTSILFNTTMQQNTTAILLNTITQQNTTALPLTVKTHTTVLPLNATAQNTTVLPLTASTQENTTALQLTATTKHTTTAILLNSTAQQNATSILLNTTTQQNTTAILLNTTSQLNTTVLPLTAATQQNTTELSLTAATQVKTTSILLNTTTQQNTTTTRPLTATTQQTTTAILFNTTTEQNTKPLPLTATTQQNTTSILLNMTSQLNTTALPLTTTTQQNTTAILLNTTYQLNTTALPLTAATQQSTTALPLMTTTQQNTTAILLNTTYQINTTALPLTTTTQQNTTAILLNTTYQLNTTALPLTAATQQSTTALPLMTTTQKNTTSILLNTTTHQNTTTLPLTATIQQNTPAILLNTTYQLNTTALPLTTTTQQNTTAILLNTTYQLNTTALPLTAATQQSTTALPLMTTTQKNTTSILLNTTTHQNTTTLPLTATTQQNTTSILLNMTSQLNTTALPLTTTTQQNTTDILLNTTYQLNTTVLPLTTTTQQNTTPILLNTTYQLNTTALPLTTTTQQNTTAILLNTTYQLNTTVLPLTGTIQQNTTTLPLTATTQQNTTSILLNMTSQLNTTALPLTTSTQQNTTAILLNTTYQLNTTALPLTTTTQQNTPSILLNTTHQLNTTTLPLTATTQQNTTSILLNMTSQINTTALPLTTATQQNTTVILLNTTYQINTTALPLTTTTQQNTTSILLNMTSQLNTTALPLTTATQQNTTVILLNTTYQINTTALPLTTTTQQNTTAILLNTTYQLNTTVLPLTTTTQQSTTALPLMTTTQQNTTSILLNTTTHQNTTALPLTATTQQNTTSILLNMTSQLNTTALPLTTTTQQNTTAILLNTTYQLNTTALPLTTTTQQNTTAILLNTTYQLNTTELPLTTTTQQNTTAILLNTTYQLNTTVLPLTATTQQNTTSILLNMTFQLNTTALPLTTTTQQNTTAIMLNTTYQVNTTALPMTATTQQSTTALPLMTTTQQNTTSILLNTTTYQNTTTLPLTATTQQNTTSILLNMTSQLNTTALPLTTTTQKNTTAILLNTTTQHNTTALPLTATTQHNTTAANNTSLTPYVTEHNATTIPLITTTLPSNITAQPDITSLPVNMTSVNTTKFKMSTTQANTTGLPPMTIIPYNATANPVNTTTYNITWHNTITHPVSPTAPYNTTSNTTVATKNNSTAFPAVITQYNMTAEQQNESTSASVQKVPTQQSTASPPVKATATVAVANTQWNVSTGVTPVAHLSNSTTDGATMEFTTGIPAQSEEAQADQLLEQTRDIAGLNSSQVQQVVSRLEDLLSGPNITLALAHRLLNIVSNLLNVSAITLAASSSRIITAVETLGLKLVVEGRTEKISSDSLALAVRKVDGASFEETSFSIADPNNLQITVRGEQKVRRRTGSLRAPTLGTIILPASLTDDLMTQEQLLASRVQFIFYQRTTVFQDMALRNRSINSGVLATSVANLSISGLRDNVVFTMQNNQPITGNFVASCVFWDHNLNEGSGGWSSDGCTVQNTTEEETTCSCNHLTSFAVLLDISREGITDRLQATIQTFITFIGCGISAIFLSITLLTYLGFEKLRRDIPSKILIQLCTALLFLNLTFLLDSWLALYPDAVGLCISTAFFLHYFLLVSFTWMGLEAFHMYLAIVKVFNSYMSRYMLKFSLFGWGVPLMVVIIVIAISKDNYGLISYGKYTDGSTDEFCWIRNDVAFYVALVAYFCLVFVINLAMFVVVMVQLRRIKRQNPNNSQHRNGLQELRSVAGLTFLLGLTWGFAFFAWGPVNLAFMYLFAILNSLQGFFIFIFHCALKENVRRKWRAYLCCGRLQLPETAASTEWSRTTIQANYKKDLLGTSIQTSDSYLSSSTSFRTNDSTELPTPTSDVSEDSIFTSLQESNVEVVVNSRHRAQRPQ